MKRKIFKRFKIGANGGFTLVELIVVIAILAILGGIGVPAYSGYVKKANMGADDSLISEIQQAILLAYYAEPDSFEGGTIIVSTEKTTADNAFLAEAMKKAFGDGWETLCLKHDGYKNTHNDYSQKIVNSNFADENGNINSEILNTVDNLTGSVANLLGQGNDMSNFGNFNNYLASNGIDPKDCQKAANAAVVYLSQATDNDKRDIMKEVLTNSNNWITDDGKISMGAFTELTLTNGCDPFPSLAASYAVMKGFCVWADSQLGTGGLYSEQLGNIDLNYYTDYEGTSDPNPPPSPVKSESHAILALEQGLAKITKGSEAEVSALFKQYIAGDALKDIDAYFGVIDGISENEDYILDNLDGSKNFYSNQAEALNAVLNTNLPSGSLGVLAYQADKNNEPKAIPMGRAE